MDIDLYRLSKLTCSADTFQGPMTLGYTAVFELELREPSDVLGYSPFQRRQERCREKPKRCNRIVMYCDALATEILRCLWQPLHITAFFIR